MTINPASEIASPVEVETILNRLDDWRGQVRQGQIKAKLHLKTPPPIDRSLAADLRRLGIRNEIDTVEKVEIVTAALKAWLEAAPVVHLRFSAPVAPADRRAIMDWLRREIHPALLADIKVDGAIATGFILRTKNRVFDFTSNRVLWEHRGRLAELARRV